MTRVQLRSSLRKDMLSVIENMKSKGGIGYLFNPDKAGKKVANGMFCNRVSNIDAKQWMYYYEFKGGITYKL